MRRIRRAGSALLSVCLLGATRPSLPPAPDPYSGPARTDVTRLLRAAQFGEPGAEAAVAHWLAEHPHAPTADRAQLWRRLCGDDLVHGRYTAAVASCGAEAAIAPGEAADDVRLAKILRDQPPINVRGTATVDLIANKLGSRSASVTVNGFSLPWFVDSGAEISVVSQSVATRLQARMLDGVVQVGTTTAPVSGQVAMIDTLTIGTATVSHVPVLVLPDAQLRIADLATIPAILGLPVMVSFGRVAWLGGGARLALGDAVPAVPAAAAKIYWHEQGIGVPIATRLATRGAHFDSGANASYLRAPGHALLSRAQEGGALTRDRRIGGAGGVVSSRQKVIRRLPLRLAGAPLVLTDVSIVEQDEDGAARIGDDAVAQLSLLTLDFGAMRVAAEALSP